MTDTGILHTEEAAIGNVADPAPASMLRAMRNAGERPVPKRIADTYVMGAQPALSGDLYESAHNMQVVSAPSRDALYGGRFDNMVGSGIWGKIKHGSEDAGRSVGKEARKQARWDSSDTAAAAGGAVAGGVTAGPAGAVAGAAGGVAANRVEESIEGSGSGWSKHFERDVGNVTAGLRHLTTKKQRKRLGDVGVRAVEQKVDPVGSALTTAATVTEPHDPLIKADRAIK